jgi:hypothetical protein
MQHVLMIEQVATSGALELLRLIGIQVDMPERSSMFRRCCCLSILDSEWRYALWSVPGRIVRLSTTTIMPSRGGEESFNSGYFEYIRRSMAGMGYYSGDADTRAM